MRHLAAAVGLLVGLGGPFARAETSAPGAAADVRSGRPFVVSVVIPLCSNDQIDCGSAAAGRAGDLRTNLYWGAIFGARRFFDRKNSGWERVDVQAGAGVLERAIYRRRVPGAAWDKQGSVEQIVVLEAIHGDQIDRSVDRFWTLATEGGRVRFTDGGRARDERIHAVGYAGHNRLMDGKKLPGAPVASRSRPVPSFVLACHSEKYFAEALEAAGSTPLVTTRSLFAPEGYVVEAAVRALGDNASTREVRDSTVRAYAKWQRLSFGQASPMFAKAPERRSGPP